MPNTFFTFKQFTVQQEDCAMKVCTEACLFGAWMASIVRSGGAGTIRTMLDIGTGTGLLSLIMAQATETGINTAEMAQATETGIDAVEIAQPIKTEIDAMNRAALITTQIDAVELDTKAAARALSNFKDSPWKERLAVIPVSIQEYSEGGNRYDFIFSNPPFYNNDLWGNDGPRNMALHDDSLSLEQLLISAGKLLRAGGFFAVLIPFRRAEYFERLLVQSPWQIRKKVNLKQTPRHSFFRAMYLLCLTDKVFPFAEEEIIIRNGLSYTGIFQDILKDYYLNIS